MLIRFAGACGRRFKAMAETVGRRFLCPSCGVEARVPGTPGANPAGAACPHCAAAIDPPPARSRKCPHCRAPIVVRRGKLLTEAAGAEFDREAAAAIAANKARRAAELYRQGRELAVHKVGEAKRGGGTIGFRLKFGPEHCKNCNGLKGKLIPIRDCTPDLLPPYQPCELDRGCLTYADEVYTPAIERALRESLRAVERGNPTGKP